MGSELVLLIVDPVRATMVCDRFIGYGRALDAAWRAFEGTAPSEESLVPDPSGYGVFCWTDVGVWEVKQIVQDGPAAGGLEPIEVDELAERFPPSRYWWLIWRDY
jgi:hypothetical protein